MKNLHKLLENSEKTFISLKIGNLSCDVSLRCHEARLFSDWMIHGHRENEEKKNIRLFLLKRVNSLNVKLKIAIVPSVRYFYRQKTIAINLPKEL